MKTHRIQGAFVLGVTLGLIAISTLQGSKIETVLVGDPGNEGRGLYGGVSYTYAIGTYEVNLEQYVTFLNAVAATDTYGLFNPEMETNLNVAGISRSGSNGSYSYSVIGSGARPVTYVSWFDAARFANWMANGQPTGGQSTVTTEEGAYTLNGATNGIGFSKNSINPNTGMATTWWIPSEHEWYKAAFFEPGASSDDYWLFATRSDSRPGNAIGADLNQANYRSGDFATTPGNDVLNPHQNYLTDGGAFSNSQSYYGTFDQAGNVAEWTDGLGSSMNHSIPGGFWYAVSGNLSGTSRTTISPATENEFIGFRLASTSIGLSPNGLYTLAISGNTGGTVIPSGILNIRAGSAIDVFATPSAGYLFQEWMGDYVSPDPEIEITVDGDIILSAIFAPDSNDTDADGLTNYEEIVIYHSNPTKVDTSGDGLNDGSVVEAGFDPTTNYSNLVEHITAKTEHGRMDAKLIEINDGIALLRLQLHRSSDLRNWSSNIEDVIELELPVSENRQFFMFSLGD